MIIVLGGGGEEEGGERGEGGRRYHDRRVHLKRFQGTFFSSGVNAMM